MSLDPELLDLFPDEVTVEPWAGADVTGDDTYGAAVTYPCRISGKAVTVLDKEGNEQTSRLHLVIAGAPGLDARDRFTLPEYYSTDKYATGDAALRARQPEAIAVSKTPDEEGPHHEKVFF